MRFSKGDIVLIKEKALPKDSPPRTGIIVGIREVMTPPWEGGPPKAIQIYRVMTESGLEEHYRSSLSLQKQERDKS